MICFDTGSILVRVSILDRVDSCYVLFRINFEIFYTDVKPSQNKKGQKKFQVHRIRCLFLQLAAEKKTKNDALGNSFGPSYFEMALVIFFSIKQHQSKTKK